MGQGKNGRGWEIANLDGIGPIHQNEGLALSDDVYFGRTMLFILLLQKLCVVPNKNLCTTISCKRTNKNETLLVRFGFHDATTTW